MPDLASTRRARLLRAAASFALLLALGASARAYDDCDSKFIAYLGADAYQFSPAHSGSLGSVRLFTVLSNQRAAVFGDLGTAYWHLEIRDEFGRVVRNVDGAATIDASGQTAGEFFWDGRDDAGRRVPPGRYSYSFLGRFLADKERGKIARTISRYADLAGVGIENEAYASTDYVIVNDALSEKEAVELRSSLAAGACQMRQNTPIEAGFGFNFYYGSTHSHSNWSDGGQPTSACSSGNAEGSGTFTPAQIYGFARNSAGLDYWVINEHNHLINDAMATNNPPVSEAKVKQRYADGRAAAVSATVNDVFVGLYGMEWGVSTNADQGHVTLLETPKLFGWETCTTCNGPNAECTAGSNCYFDVFTPKRFGYLTMYKRSVENPSPAGAL
ncbi:MAG TPA: FlgD immunoglobulin-like domain containing protein, partial [Thermoanaerobaculia bacterium]|nr:FlgD immunoglobulin-like domain containing protein [Thermoanaerobaculia bacterium]